MTRSWHCVAAMAGVAGYSILSNRLAEVGYHLHHIAGYGFPWIVVAREVARNMAMSAVLAK